MCVEESLCVPCMFHHESIYADIIAHVDHLFFVGSLENLKVRVPRLGLCNKVQVRGARDGDERDGVLGTSRCLEIHVGPTHAASVPSAEDRGVKCSASHGSTLVIVHNFISIYIDWCIRKKTIKTEEELHSFDLAVGPGPHCCNPKVLTFV